MTVRASNVGAMVLTPVGTIVRFGGVTNQPNRKHKMARAKGPGKSYRTGLSLMEAFDRFPDDAAAERWFVEARWGRRAHMPALREHQRPDGREA